MGYSRQGVLVDHEGGGVGEGERQEPKSLGQVVGALVEEVSDSGFGEPLGQVGAGFIRLVDADVDKCAAVPGHDRSALPTCREHVSGAGHADGPQPSRVQGTEIANVVEHDEPGPAGARQPCAEFRGVPVAILALRAAAGD